jgi:hypothetical protein
MFSLISALPLAYLPLGQTSAARLLFTSSHTTIFASLIGLAFIGLVLASRRRKIAQTILAGSLLVLGCVGVWRCQHTGFQAERVAALPIQWHSTPPPTASDPTTAQTLARLERLYDTLVLHVMHTRSAPGDLSELQQNAGFAATDFLDGWGRPIRYTHQHHQLAVAFQLASAGPDGLFGTHDDIGRSGRWKGATSGPP